MKRRPGLRPGQVAAEFGRSASWLRQLEAAGIIPRVARDPLNGERRYSWADVERIREILSQRRREPEPAGVSMR